MKYDTLLVERAYPEEYDQEQPIDVQIFLHPIHHPKKFKLSTDLQKILGVKEETRAKVVAALWQYIKSNRL